MQAICKHADNNDMYCCIVLFFADIYTCQILGCIYVAYPCMP